MEDIFRTIFMLLQIKDIIACSLVNKVFHKITSLPIVWQNLLAVDYKDTKHTTLNTERLNHYDTYKFCYGIKSLLKLKGCNENTLYQLKCLNVVCKNIKILPPIIGNLINLTEINASNNYLTSIPPEIGLLYNLEYLNLNSNILTTVPSEIGNLRKLRRINLCDNRLTSIPPEFGNLFTLDCMHLSRNKLITLPPELGKLNLRVLNASFNQITTIPLGLEKLCDTNVLMVDGNPCEFKTQTKYKKF